MPIGSYTLSAKATDNSGATVESSLVNISVVNSPPSAVALLNPAIDGTNFSFSFAAQTGFAYTVLRTDSLSTINWQELTNFIGNGASANVSDGSRATQRFYQVTAQ